MVISIIAILSAIGMAVYSGLQGSARDAKRKADVDAIAKAYEKNYDSLSGVYEAIGDDDFTSKEKPTPPEGGTYNDTWVSGTADKAFTVCAALEAHPAGASCTPTSSTCYCQSSALGDTASGGGGATPCTTFTFGQTCIVGTGSTTSPGSTIYIDCPTLTSLPAAHTTLDCSQQNSNIGHVTLPFYNAAGAATPAGNSTFLFPAPPPPYPSTIWSVTVQKH